MESLWAESKLKRNFWAMFFFDFMISVASLAALLLFLCLSVFLSFST